jgi:integrase
MHFDTKGHETSRTILGCLARKVNSGGNETYVTNLLVLNPGTNYAVEVWGAKLHGKPRERMIFILCGAAGLRIGEVLGIEIDKHLSTDFLTLHIQQKARRGKIERRLKTANAYRQVDLHPVIAALLKPFVGNRKEQEGLLFCTRMGKPLSVTNIIRRQLHKALEEMKYVNPYTGTHKAGNHAFRRFRNTYPCGITRTARRVCTSIGWATPGGT